MKTKIFFLAALISCITTTKAQSIQSVDLSYNDTIFVSKLHISYVDPRNINLTELDLKSPFIRVEKTNSNILKLIATEDFSGKIPNIYPVAFITPEKAIIKIIKYNANLQSYLYHFSPAQMEKERIDSNSVEKVSTTVTTTVFNPKKDLFDRLEIEDQNAYIPYFKNKIEACIGGIRHDKQYYYFIIKIVNKGNKPFTLDYCHMILQEDSGRKLKNSLSQMKPVEAEILNKVSLSKNQQSYVVVKTPLININDNSFLFLELFDNESHYDKEDVRTISFKIRNNEIVESKPI